MNEHNLKLTIMPKQHVQHSFFDKIQGVFKEFASKILKQVYVSTWGRISKLHHQYIQHK